MSRVQNRARRVRVLACTLCLHLLFNGLEAFPFSTRALGTVFKPTSSCFYPNASSHFTATLHVCSRGLARRAMFEQRMFWNGGFNMRYAEFAWMFQVAGIQYVAYCGSASRRMYGKVDKHLVRRAFSNCPPSILLHTHIPWKCKPHASYSCCGSAGHGCSACLTLASMHRKTCSLQRTRGWFVTRLFRRKT